ADIEAMTWHTNLPLPFAISTNIQTQSSQQTDNFRIIHLQAEHLLDALSAQRHRSNARQVLWIDDFDNWSGFTTDDFQQQDSRPLHCLTRQLPVHTTLEAVRGTRVQTVRASLASDGNGVEERTFQEQITGLFVDAAMFAAHHAGNSQGTIVISNHQRI